MLTVSLVFSYSQSVRTWIPLLIWSHVDHFSCVLLLTDCMCLEFFTDLISCWLFLLCFPINRLYVLGNHYWFDLVLTVYLVLAYSQSVCALNFLLIWSSRWLFLLCFPIDSLYVLGISLPIWSHADCFCLPVHSMMMIEEVRGLTPWAINCSHRWMYVPEIHYWFDHISTVPFSEDVVSFMIPWHLNDMRFMCGGIYVFWITPIEHWTCLKLMPHCSNDCFMCCCYFILFSFHI